MSVCGDILFNARSQKKKTLQKKTLLLTRSIPVITGSGSSNNHVVVQLTEEQLQLLVSNEHLTHEVIQAHQQSNLHEITPPETRQTTVVPPVSAGIWMPFDEQNLSGFKSHSS